MVLLLSRRAPAQTPHECDRAGHKNEINANVIERAIIVPDFRRLCKSRALRDIARDSALCPVDKKMRHCK
jgi:hypothetical protein